MLWSLLSLAVASPILLPKNTLDLVQWSDEVLVSVQEESTVWLAADGEEIHKEALGGRSLLVVDLNDDGAPELLRCGERGLELVREPKEKRAPLVLSKHACTDVVTFTTTKTISVAYRSKKRLYVLTPRAGELDVAGHYLGITADIDSSGEEVAVATDRGTYIWRPGAAPVLRFEEPTNQVVFDGQSWRYWLENGLLRTGLSDELRPDLISLLPGSSSVATSASPVQPSRKPHFISEEQGCRRYIAIVGEEGVELNTCSDEPSQVVENLQPPAVEVQVQPSSLQTLPSPPTEALLKPLGAATIRMYAGQTLRVKLSDSARHRLRFRSRGVGPPGLQVRRDGWLTYTATKEDIGRWRVPLRIRGPGRDHPVLVVEVHPVPRGWRVATDEAVEELPAFERGPLLTYAPNPSTTQQLIPASGLFEGEGFRIGLGASYGVFDNRGVSWETIGGSSTWRPLSTQISALYEGGSLYSVRWSVGLEAAPTFDYPLPFDVGTHQTMVVFSLDSGRALRAGPFVGGGTGAVLGLRGLWLPFRGRFGHRHGLEARIAWVPGSVGGVTTLMWSHHL